MFGRFHDGVKQKIMATHNLNAASSRSHCIYTLYVESMDPANPDDVIKAKLSLGTSCCQRRHALMTCVVDLAGSERAISNKPVKNEDPKIQLIQKLRAEIASLKAQLAQAQQVILHMGELGAAQEGSNDKTVPDKRGVPPARNDNDLTSILPPTATQASETPGHCIPRPNNQTEAAIPPLPPSVSSVAPPAALIAAGDKQLKLNVIDNVQFIKSMYEYLVVGKGPEDDCVVDLVPPRQDRIDDVMRRCMKPIRSQVQMHLVPPYDNAIDDHFPICNLQPMEHASGGKKLWGGRFSGEIDPVMNKFNESLSVDKRMWAADIRGSKAYASALHAAEVITTEENAAIQGGLNQVYHEWENGMFATVPGDEDIHTANERRLTELIGSAGGKLHTGRSRNDQVATDVRIYLKDAITGLSHQLKELIGVATQLAESNIALLMPGFTHLQPAQPIRFAHWVMSHVAALQRDAERLEDLYKRVDVLPLGSGALAGNSFGIDRALLAKELNFARISPNSLVRRILKDSMDPRCPGMPRSYNKDLQEDKSALFYVIDTMVDCIQIAAGVLATLTPNEAKMRGFLVTEMLATDLAEYLVRRGVPFRETHHVAGAAVRLAEVAGKALSDLTLAELQSLHPKFEPDVMAIWDFEASVERKNVPGGTSESAVQDHIHAVKAWIANSA
ncbi:hypothetical protein DYB32_006972 [Aphanomyces invadans]|uniref:Argininosuccinate lyase n=1 Tax=Aphanomyces invadans TaxID=157072 RepID=A0A418AQ47_9STRA|nr:hypothetical protein DYB32_006972 [Aphanomyces invadans]